MNCFEWQNRASEYLDGTLMGPAKGEADEHLDRCEGCSTRYKHYRLILTSISSQPRVSLPATIRKAPFSVPISPRQKPRLGERLGQWSRAPWYVRVPIEAAGIVVLISLGISAGPRMRSIYERKIEQSLNEYNADLGSPVVDMEPQAKAPETVVAPTAQAKAASQATVTKTSFVANGSAMDSDSDVTIGGDGSEGDTPNLKAGPYDIWRFNLKTDSPSDVRVKVVKILESLKIPPSNPGINGMDVPGGIQFDLVVPAGIIPDLKRALEKIAPPPPKNLADSPFGQTFTWYKKPAWKRVAPGHTHVVIWLAQI